MIDRALIEKKMREENPHVTSQYEIDCLVDFVLDNYVKELEPNILEWIHNEPFSKIYVGEECVSSLLQYWEHGINWYFYHRPSRDFTEALRCFKLYKEDGLRSPYSLREHYGRQEWRKMQPAIRERIYERLLEDHPGKERYVTLLMDEICFFYLEELEQNLLEWAERRQLSDIYVGELSINRLTMGEDFLMWEVLEYMVLYKSMGCRKAEDIIEMYHRRHWVCGFAESLRYSDRLRAGKKSAVQGVEKEKGSWLRQVLDWINRRKTK